MSKKKNKKGSAVQVNNLAGAAGLMGGSTESVGFESLIPTPKGQEKLNNIHKRRGSKLTSAAGLDAEALNSIGAAADKPEPKPFDLQPMSNMLDELEDLVKAGKYKKAMDVKGREKVVNAFISFFGEFDPAAANADKVYGMVRKLLSIAKSFYEYDSDLHELIPNATYDGLLAKYLAAGRQEPVGIVPKGSKNLQKASITYPTLHNNMDKAYALREGDPVPEGVKETDTVEAFLDRVYKAISATPETAITLELSPKIDGVSVNGTIKGQMLTAPQTRGDSEESIKVLGMNNMVVSLDEASKAEFGIQYEAFCTDEDRVNASRYLHLASEYVSCRHAASGIVHRLCTGEDDGLLQFISLYPIASEGLDGTYAERIQMLQKFGIIPDDMLTRVTVSGTRDQLLTEIKEWFDEFESAREKLSFAIDGMVITVLDDEYQEAIGREGRTNKYQIALKFDPANATAVVHHIGLDSGKKGFRTVQVYLEHPVFLDGVRYDHVPVLSANLYEQMNLRKGSTVNVHRVGDVIPSLSVIKEGTGKKLPLPTICPDCGHPLKIQNKKLYCSNTTCPGNVAGRFTAFFAMLGLDGYADSFADMLHDQLGCKTLGDMAKLTKEAFEKAGITQKLALEFPEAFKKAMGEKKDYEVLGAMGLYGVGPARAKMILKEVPFNKLHELRSVKALAIATEAIGPNSAAFLENDLMSDIFKADVKVLLPMIGSITKDFGKLIRVGHTGGKLSDEAITACKQNNFEIVDGKSFDILITTSMDRESGKMEAAKSRNLPICLEEDFIEQYYNEDADEPSEDETESDSTKKAS